MLKQILGLGLLLAVTGTGFSQRIDPSRKDSVLDVAGSRQQGKAQADAWYWLGRFYRRTNADSAALCYQKALEIYRQLGDKKNQARTLELIGYLQYKLGDFEKALGPLKAAVALANEISDDTLAGKVAQVLANTYSQIGMMDSAHVNYLLALKVAEQHKDTTQQTLSLVAMGSNYYHARRFNDALTYLKQALSIARAANDERNVGMILGNMANAYFQQDADSVHLALNLSYKGYELVSKYKMMEEYEFYALLNIIQFESILGGEAAARKAFQKASAMAEDQRSDFKRAELYSTWGTGLMDLKRPVEAIGWLQKGFDLAKNQGNVITMQSLAGALSLAYEATADWKSAHTWNMVHFRLRDSTSNADLSKRIEELNLQYATEKKDRELAEQALKLEAQASKIQLLTGGALLLALALAAGLVFFRQKRALNLQQIRQLEQEKEVAGLKAMMAGEEKERTRIAKELHDGLGGLLSAAKLQFSALRDREPALTIAPGFEQGLALLDTVSSEARKISHNLMPEMLTRLGLAEAARQFCQQVTNAGALIIDFEYYGPEERLPASVELSIYRILQELVNNVMKHAGATEATVQIVRDEKVMAITVEDNGRGFAPIATPGIGLDSIRSRLEFLGGKMDVQSDPERGASVFIEIILSR